MSPQRKKIDKEKKEGYYEDTEDVVPEDELDHTPTRLKRLREKLAECEAGKRELLDGWQRAKAEFVNARKQDAAEAERRGDRALEAFLVDLLPILESFDLAFADTEAWEATPKEWRVGVEQIHTKFLEALVRNGVTQMDPTGERFDPTLHEAVDSAGVEDEKDDQKILRVLQKGYRVAGRVVRAPKVRIGVFRK